MPSHRLLRSALAASIITLSPVLVPAVTGGIAPAAAAVDISINLDTFYNGLANYGDWISYRGAYVWVPGNVGPQWRPYSVGRWVWTDDYGWLWVSEEPFGWAAYHYGRWGYSNEIGWYWVPGYRWAPAWVSWRNDDSDIGWAPLPPEADDEMATISYDTLPDYYWNVVPARQFMAPNLQLSLVFDMGQRRRLFNAPHGGNIMFNNNRPMNNFIDVNFVRRQTGDPVRPVRLTQAPHPGAPRLSGGELTTFMGNVDRTKNARPPKTVDLSVVKPKVHDRIRTDKPLKEFGLPPSGKGGAGAIGNGQTGPAGIGGNTGQGQPTGLKTKKRLPSTGTDQTGAPVMGGAGGDNGTPGAGVNGSGQPGLKKKNKRLPPSGTDQTGAPGMGGTTGNGGAPGAGVNGQEQPFTGKKKKRLPPADSGQPGMGGMSGQDNGGVQVIKPNKKLRQLSPGSGMENGAEQMQGGQGGNNPQQLRRLKKQQMEQMNGQSGNPDGMNQMPAKRLKQQQMEQMNGQQPPGMNRGKGKKPACDPQTDPSCIPGQQ